MPSRSGRDLLIFDFQVIADGVLDQVILDQPRDKRLGPVRIPEIDTGPRAENPVVADDPAPGRRLGRDPIRLLIAILTHERVALDADVMHQVIPAAVGADSESAGYAAAVDPQILNGEVAAVRDLDRILIRFSHDDGRLPLGGDP